MWTRAGWTAILIALVACGGEQASETAPQPGPDDPVEVGDASDAPETWTRGGATEGSTVTSEVTVLTKLRTGRHDEFERIVLELGDRGGGFPGHTVEYVDRPLHDCGSGEETFPVGDAWLEIRLYPIDAHTQEGQPTVDHKPHDLPGLENILRVYTTCDFEAVVTLVLAMRSPKEFRVFRLDAPRRIVVDVRK